MKCQMSPDDVRSLVMAYLGSLAFVLEVDIGALREGLREVVDDDEGWLAMSIAVPRETVTARVSAEIARLEARDVLRRRGRS